MLARRSVLAGGAAALLAQGAPVGLAQSINAVPRRDPGGMRTVRLLANHVAVAKGTDVDQPRNLAKSVTVE